jgi:glycosyltransferase involved in cell wall biosynthesis
VVGNGVDLQRFRRLDKHQCRADLGLLPDAPVLVTVGGLVERKGFHRVMACLPELLRQHPGLVYLVVGGPSPEGDWTEKLKALAVELGVVDQVRFLGALKPDQLAPVLSAADVFALSTRNEGWANVFLEAMACGLPVVTTRVGGNAEVVCQDTLGEVLAFDDHAALCQALDRALRRPWDRDAIVSYAQANTWDRRIEVLLGEFARVVDEYRKRHANGEGMKRS